MDNHFRIPWQRRVSIPGHLISAAMIAWGMLAASKSIAQTPTAPPVAPVRVVTEDYFGTKVSDSYRYMENLKDPEVVAWFKAQSDYTRSVLDTISGVAGAYQGA